MLIKLCLKWNTFLILHNHLNNNAVILKATGITRNTVLGPDSIPSVIHIKTPFTCEAAPYFLRFRDQEIMAPETIVPRHGACT